MKCSKFVSLINFPRQYPPHHQNLNCHRSVLLVQTPLQLDLEVIKETEDGEGQLFEGGYYFKYFRGWGKGGVAIIPGRQLIEGRLLFEEILYMYFYLMDIFVQEEGPTKVWVTYFTVKDVSPEFKCFKN